MSPTRQKLSLDEQTFQDLLAAAYTIQEHNAKMKRPVGAQRFCGYCGSPLLPGEDRCALCDADVQGYRSGEQLQHKWASLWDMQQQQEADSAGPADETLPSPSELPSFHSGPLQTDLVDETAPVAETPANGSHRNLHEFPSPPAESVLFATRTPEPAEVEVAEDLPEPPREDFAPEYITVPVDERCLAPIDSATEEEPAEIDQGPEPESSPAPNPRLKLRFGRGDFYLGLAITVAALALLWVAFGKSATAGPAPAAAPHGVQLSLWERALVSVGLADPPEEPAYSGDPAVQVWVDPHTALYYCQGAEQYGKTPNGHYSTQREAQRDWFEPAERSVCE